MNIQVKILDNYVKNKYLHYQDSLIIEPLNDVQLEGARASVYNISKNVLKDSNFRAVRFPGKYGLACNIQMCIPSGYKVNYNYRNYIYPDIQLFLPLKTEFVGTHSQFILPILSLCYLPLAKDAAIGKLSISLDDNTATRWQKIKWFFGFRPAFEILNFDGKYREMVTK